MKRKVKEYKFDLESEDDYPSVKQQVTLKDLCQEDKLKIGNLIKKLAQEKNEKENLVQELQSTKKNYEEQLKVYQSNKTQKSQSSIKQDTNKSLTSQKQNDMKVSKLKSEIEELDNEIQVCQSLLQIDNGHKQSQSQVVLTTNQQLHQSPNFKGLLPKSKQNSDKKDEYQQLFKQQLNQEPSSSFFNSQMTSYRNSNKAKDQQIQTSIIEQNQILEEDQQSIRMLKQQKEPNISISSQSYQEQSFEIMSDKKQKGDDTSKKNKSKQKEQLMQKIMEFEKIVNRLNFSKVSENDNLSVNESQNQSLMQNVYKKILSLEEEIQRLNLEKNQKQKRFTEDEQQQNRNEDDDLVIALLNSSSYQSNRQKNIRNQDMSEEIYSQSFFSLVDNIEMSEQNKKMRAQSSMKQTMITDQTRKAMSCSPEQNMDSYCKTVLSKYNDLMQELQNDFQRTL